LSRQSNQSDLEAFDIGQVLREIITVWAIREDC